MRRYYCNAKCKNLKTENFSDDYLRLRSDILCLLISSSNNVLASREGGLRFKSMAGQIGHSFVNGLSPLRHFIGRNCDAGRNDEKMGPTNSLYSST